MTTPITNSPGLPAHRYNDHLETVIQPPPKLVVTRPWLALALCALAAGVSVGWLWFCFYSPGALDILP